MKLIIILHLLCTSALLCVSSISTVDIPYKDAGIIEFNDMYSNYTSLLVYDGYLYIGCLNGSTQEGYLLKKDASLKTNGGTDTLLVSPPGYYMKNIMQNRNEIYVCGSHETETGTERNPKLYKVNSGFSSSTKIKGQYKCPFRPQHFAAAVFDSGGKFYSAAQYENLGASGISQSQSVNDTPSLHSVNDDKWIYKSPDYFDAYHIEHTSEIYIFFLELAYENVNQFPEKYPRVGKVCTQDSGGPTNTLNGKFTSYQKARLSCEFEGNAYNTLKSIFKVGSNGNEVFYGIFVEDMGGISVVCSYSVDDIRTVLTSEKYKNLPSTGKLWVAENYNSDPYPGECDDDSKNIPETTLNALKSHPLMWDSVPSIESQTTDSLPLLTSEGLGKQFTKILVAEVPDIAGTIHKVMYIGTDQGTVIKALYGDQAAYMYIITEFIVDEDSRDVLIMTMSDESLYIAFDDKVIQVPMQFCDRYTNCYSCVAARDPHCSWDTESSTCVTGGDYTGNFIQDVPGGNVALCSVQPKPGKPGKPDKCVKKVPLDSAVIFDCKVMGAIFMKDGDEITVDGVKYIRLNGVGLLITNFKESDSGVYSCTVGGEIVAECWLISANQTLSTNVPEIHNLNLGPENITYPENTTVNLYCMFTGCFDTEYRWLNKDGIEVIETGSVMLESDCAANNESKIISWLEAIVGEETQTYTCEVDHVITKVFEIKPGAIENDANCRKDHMEWEIEYYDEIKKLNDWRQQANCTDENDDKIEINSCEMKDYCGIP